MKRLAGVVLAIVLSGNASLAPSAQLAWADPAVAGAADADTQHIQLTHYFDEQHGWNLASVGDDGKPLEESCDGVLFRASSLSEFRKIYPDVNLVGNTTRNGVCSQIFESKIQFPLDDLAQVHIGSITKATFSFDSSATGGCISAISAISPGLAPDGRYQYFPENYTKSDRSLSSSYQEYDVTSAVQHWYSGKWDNFGFGLRGPQAALDVDAPTSECLADVSRFQLDIDYQPTSVADLQVTRLEVHNQSGATGCSSDGLNTLTVVIHNAGDAAPAKAVDLAIDYGLRTDHVEEVHRQLPGAITAGPGGEQRIDFTQLPIGSDGTLINVTIDRANTVSLKSHADPTFQGNVTCVNRGVDLTIKQAQLNGVDLSSPDVKNACIAGAKNLVHIVISNLGDKDPSVFDVGLLVDGKLLAHSTVGGVSPHSDKDSYLEDVNIPAGTHKIQAVVDQDHKITEASDDNNTSPSATVTCSPPSR